MQYVTDLLDLTTTYQGAITALATAVIAATGIATVWLTATLARENRLLHKAGTEPDVVAYLIPDQRYKTMLNFVVANIGRGPARNVTFIFDADPADFAAHDVQFAANQSRAAIAILPQDERISAFFGAGPDLFKDPRLQPFKVKVEFEDLRQKRRSKTFDLDVSQFDRLITLGQPAEHEMAEALKKMAETMTGWSTIRRLKVETITTEEIEQRAVAARNAALARQNQGRGAGQQPADHEADGGS